MHNNHNYKRNSPSSSFDNKRNRRNFNDRITDNISFLCNSKDIVINKIPKFTYTPNNYRHYDKDLLYSKDYWHEITVSLLKSIKIH